VWDDGFAGVWHLGEDGTASEYQDSTWNDNTGIGGFISSSSAPERSTDSVSGYSQDFPNADDRIDVGTWDISGDAVTFSGWFYHESGFNNDNRIITKANGYTGASVFWELGVGNGSTMRFRVQTLGVEADYSAGAITQNTWQYGTGVYDGTRMYLYLDGNLTGSWAKTGNINTDSGVGVNIGNTPPGNRSFDGKLDEIRASNVARSVDWIKTQFQTQSLSAHGAPTNVSGQAVTVDSSKFIKKKGWQQYYYQYRKLITINKNQVVGTHSNFPVLINITLDSAKVKSTNGYDIMFTNEYGEKLNHEIDSYNSGTGELLAWVKIPTLSSLKDTKLYIYYGNSDITADPSTTNVWETNYKAVWHMTEINVIDSTSNGNSGISYGSMTSGDQVAGKIGTSLDFDGIDDWISISDSSTLDADLNSAFTLSFWYNKTSQIDGVWDGIVEKEDSDTLWSYGFYTTPTEIRAAVSDTGNPVEYTNPHNVSTGTWNHIVLVYNGSTIKQYLNASASADGPNPLGVYDGAGVLQFGRGTWASATKYSNCLLDEVRIFSDARSDGWIATEYANQSDTSVGLTAGLPQNMPIRATRALAPISSSGA
jgi:hypothetical protein